jgi:hypothetical protein
MKKLTLLLSSLSMAMAASSAFANMCPSPDNFTITKKSDGTFAVNVPSGYTYLGEGSRISQTEPISFMEAEIRSRVETRSPNGPYSNIVAERDVWCEYGVAETPDTSGGIFFVTVDGTKNHSFNLGKNWGTPIVGSRIYSCRTWKTGYKAADCTYVLSH